MAQPLQTNRRLSTLLPLLVSARLTNVFRGIVRFLSVLQISYRGLKGNHVFLGIYREAGVIQRF
jgi:hypothetical protein